MFVRAPCTSVAVDALLREQSEAPLSLPPTNSIERSDASPRELSTNRAAPIGLRPWDALRDWPAAPAAKYNIKNAHSAARTHTASPSSCTRELNVHLSFLFRSTRTLCHPIPRWYSSVSLKAKHTESSLARAKNISLANGGPLSALSEITWNPITFAGHNRE